MNEDDVRKEIQDLRELIARIPARFATTTEEPRLRYAKMKTDMYESKGVGVDNAIICDKDGVVTTREIKVYADYQKGYYFADDIVLIRKLSDKEQIFSPGETYIGGNTNTPVQLAKGATDIRALANGKSVNIYSPYGDLGASKGYAVQWCALHHRWEVPAAECV